MATVAAAHDEKKNGERNIHSLHKFVRACHMRVRARPSPDGPEHTGQDNGYRTKPAAVRKFERIKESSFASTGEVGRDCGS